MYPICVQCLIMAQETSRNIADKMIAPEMRLTSSSIPGARVFRETLKFINNMDCFPFFLNSPSMFLFNLMDGTKLIEICMLHLLILFMQ